MTIDVKANDKDADHDNSQLTVSKPELKDPSQGNVIVDADGKLVFTPAPNVTGPVEITYTLTGTNSGKTQLNPVVITDDLSKVLDKASIDKAPVASIVKDGKSTKAPVQPTLTGDQLSWTGTLQQGEQIVIQFVSDLHTLQFTE